MTQLIPCLTSEVTCHWSVGTEQKEGCDGTVNGREHLSVLATTVLVRLRRQKESRNRRVRQQPLLMSICPAQTQVQVLPFKVPYHSVLSILLTSFETAPALGRE